MPDGIRATVEFSEPDICPIVELSAAAETTIDSVATSVCAGDCTECVSEFWVESETEFETDLTPIFTDGSTGRYRLTHDGDTDCPCECLGRFGCPVASYVARNGRLRLVFHAADYDELQTVVTELRDRFPGVNIKRFVRSPEEKHTQDRVLVDRNKLTDRQLEVLETAYERGYFERPRRANATEIAAELDINPSTFREHLSAAESKLFGDVL